MTTLPALSKDGSVHVTDEVWNTRISSLGAVLTVCGVSFLLWRSAAMASPVRVRSFLIYGLGTLSVFVTSALHHGFHGTPRQDFLLRQADYLAIFLMIAGTFTPFCLVLVPGPLSTGVLVFVWLLAAAGIASKALYPALPKWATLAMTIGMGWVAVVLVPQVYGALRLAGLVSVAVGGAFFTVGGLIFGLEKPNPLPGRFGFHEIWHCFVVAGASCHFATMCMCL